MATYVAHRGKGIEGRQVKLLQLCLLGRHHPRWKPPGLRDSAKKTTFFLATDHPGKMPVRISKLRLGSERSGVSRQLAIGGLQGAELWRELISGTAALEGRERERESRKVRGVA